MPAFDTATSSAGWSTRQLETSPSAAAAARADRAGLNAQPSSTTATVVASRRRVTLVTPSDASLAASAEPMRTPAPTGQSISAFAIAIPPVRAVGYAGSGGTYLAGTLGFIGGTPYQSHPDARQAPCD